MAFTDEKKPGRLGFGELSITHPTLKSIISHGLLMLIHYQFTVPCSYFSYSVPSGFGLLIPTVEHYTRRFVNFKRNLATITVASGTRQGLIPPHKLTGKDAGPFVIPHLVNR